MPWRMDCDAGFGRRAIDATHKINQIDYLAEIFLRTIVWRQAFMQVCR